MKRTLYLVAASAAVAVAMPVIAQVSALERMISECKRQMALGICTAQIDQADYPPNATVLLAGVGRIPLDAYLRIRNADKEMCPLARTFCTSNPDSDECKTATALWGR